MKIKFFLILFFIVFLTSCAYQDFGSLDFSDAAKGELNQLLQKSTSFDTFDIKYNFYTIIANQKLVDISFHNIKQGRNQRQEVFGNLLNFNLSTYSVTNNEKQVTCALFDGLWECSAGDEVCKETPKKGKLCQSVSQEGIPPTIKPEMLAKAKVAKAEPRQIISIEVQCYKLVSTEGGKQSLTEACLNQDGIIMLMKTSAGTFEARIEAKSFSKTVNPNSFAMPSIMT